MRLKRVYIHVKDRKYRQKLYKECFVGSMAVDFFVNSSMANSRKEAVQLGRQLVQQLNLFQHVVGDHQFKDDVSASSRTYSLGGE